MTIGFSLRAAAGAIALAACFASAPAFAAFQSFVSTKGANVGTCATVTAPCRTFAYAHNQTNPGGEIIALDAGDYGPLFINKSLSITAAVEGVSARGELGGFLSTIFVSSGSEGVVELTGLTFDGLGSVENGLNIGTNKLVTVKKCAFQNYISSALFANFGSPAKILVEDASVSNAGDGVFCPATCTINRVSIKKSGFAGITSSVGSVTASEVTIAGSDKGTSGSMRLNRSVITGNNVGVQNLVDSAGDNFVRGNGTNLNVAPNVVGKQ